MPQNFSLAIHGGSGTILRSKLSPEQEANYLKTLNEAGEEGKAILASGGTAVDAVCASVVALEDSPLFNAGKGSVFASNGANEMDASIMDGSNLYAGSVAMVKGVRNPIELARLVMEKSGHVFLAGEGAEEFARSQNVKFESPQYFHDELRFKQWQSVKDTDKTQLDHTPLTDEKFGTVGAVACDLNGNLAAATSTGGMTNKKFGRVGDSPIIGCGTYANNATCAVSCTGSGEYFIRGVVAYDVSCLMEYKGLTLQEACDTVIHDRLLRIGGDGGLIAVDTKGNIALPFNTEGMYRASLVDGKIFAEIFK
ncbi:MAG: isoaspartyl peptidase/L-asparaginase [Flavobacteriales bacterium]|nr:isoaspartyl peptidase/L-asparaginase [Flavobacteriales bacterium]